MTKKIVDNKKKSEAGVLNAKFSTESVLNSMQTIQLFSNDNADIVILLNEINKQVDKVIDGDTRRIETMLMTQAQTLDVIFHKMIRSTMGAKILPQFQAYADLGLKAQNQCRKALLALAEVKNPKRATFIKQQNNAVNQQVNNGINSENLKNKNIANELLSEVKNETLDDRRASAALNINLPMEALVESGCQNFRG